MEKKVMLKNTEVYKLKVGESGRHGTREVDRYYFIDVDGVRLFDTICVEDSRDIERYVSVYATQNGVVLHWEVYDSWQGHVDRAYTVEVGYDELFGGSTDKIEPWLMYKIVEKIKELGLIEM